MYKLKELPQKGDIVLAKVKKIIGNGAFVELMEYVDKNNQFLEAFLPIYELAGRVKNIKNFIREGDVIVVQVFDVRGNRIDVSLRRVNEEQRRLKLEFYKREQKAHKLLVDLAKKLGMNEEEMYNKLGYKILEKYESLYDFFIEVLKEGKKAIKFRLPKKIKDELYELITQRIKLPEVKLEGILELICLEGDGVERIKKVLLEILKEDKVEIIYIGAPKYKLIIKGPDYKEIRKRLKKILEKAEEIAKKEKVEFKFKEIEE
jgi:translation initiation factor 2 subunit 1